MAVTGRFIKSSRWGSGSPAPIRGAGRSADGGANSHDRGPGLARAARVSHWTRRGRPGPSGRVETEAGVPARRVEDGTKGDPAMDGRRPLHSQLTGQTGKDGSTISIDLPWPVDSSTPNALSMAVRFLWGLWPRSSRKFTQPIVRTIPQAQVVGLPPSKGYGRLRARAWPGSGTGPSTRPYRCSRQKASVRATMAS